MTETEYTTWQQAVRGVDLPLEAAYIRVVVEYSPNGCPPWTRQEIAKGDDALTVLGVLNYGYSGDVSPANPTASDDPDLNCEGCGNVLPAGNCVFCDECIEAASKVF